MRFPLVHFWAVLPLLLLLGALPASAADPDDASMSAFRIALLGGAAGVGSSSPHYFGGPEVGILASRFGGLGMLQWGGSRAFTSLLTGAGPAIDLPVPTRVSAVGFVGPGLYGESVPTGARRWALVPLGGLSIRIPIGPVSAAAALTVWRGGFSGPDFEERIRVSGARVSFGVGWRP